jgi:hypothetical protein
MAEIYALYSARDGKVRYVGKTIRSRADRFEQHKRIAVGRYVTRVYDWLHNEWRHGYPVEYALLERCSNESCRQIEKEWMNKFPNLLNEQSYIYRGGSPPVIREIRKYMHSHRPNCGGFRGIHWWGDIGQYTVLTYSGEWLLGDAAPGWGGNIFFSDRTTALNARERYRQFGPQIKWLPDIEESEF